MGSFGRPIPLTAGGWHIGSGVMAGGEGEGPLMDRDQPLGGRVRITDLDLAVYEDLGYEVR